MRIAIATLAAGLFLAPRAVVAQPAELAQAKTLLERSRAELSAEHFALLSSRLAEAEAAYVAFITATGAVEAAGSTAAVTTGGRVLLGGAAELLGLLLLAWPSTAHAPGNKEETPKVRAARVKLDEKVKDLTQAAQKVESERKEAARPKKKKKCMCICGDPKGKKRTERKVLDYMLEFECREQCFAEHGFPLEQYSCQ